MNVKEFKSVQNVLVSISVGTVNNFTSALGQYVQFVNSREGLEHEITPDDLIEETKNDITVTQHRLEEFYR